MSLKSTISNTILDADGNAIANVPVNITLMPTGGFRIDDQTEVATLYSTTTNASGFWSAALEQQANITPTGSWYQVDELVPAANGGTRTYFISVGASPQTLLASLVTPSQTQPTVVPAGTVYISQASGDARYQQLGSLSSATPATETPATTGAPGVSTAAARADHAHPTAAGTPVAIGSALAAGSATTFARSDHVHTGPLGTLGYAQVTAGQSSITSQVDLTGLSVTFTAVAGRRYRVSAEVGLQRSVADGISRLFIMEGATTLQFRDGLVHGAAEGAVVLPASVVLTGVSAGPHTYKLQMQNTTGTGSTTMSAASTNPAYILVEDIGT